MSDMVVVVRVKECKTRRGHSDALRDQCSVIRGLGGIAVANQRRGAWAIIFNIELDTAHDAGRPPRLVPVFTFVDLRCVR